MDLSFTGGGTADVAKEMYARTYISPWEKAMKGNEGLGNLKTGMPGPNQMKDLPKYKSFNRYFRTLISYIFFLNP